MGNVYLWKLISFWPHVLLPYCIIEEVLFKYLKIFPHHNSWKPKRKLVWERICISVSFDSFFPPTRCWNKWSLRAKYSSGLKCSQTWKSWKCVSYRMERWTWELTNLVKKRIQKAQQRNHFQQVFNHLRSVGITHRGTSLIPKIIPIFVILWRYFLDKYIVICFNKWIYAYIYQGQTMVLIMECQKPA